MTQILSPPSHTAKPCPPPPGWTGGNVNIAQTTFLVGQSIPVSCPKGQRFKGYQRKGNATLTCRSDQTWTPITAVCESEYKHLSPIWSQIIQHRHLTIPR